MKYRYLSIAILILILSIGAVCAQEDAADAGVVATDSEDILSVDNNVNILENEISSGDSVSIENNAVPENTNISDSDKLAGNINENVFEKNSDYDSEIAGNYPVSSELLGYGGVEDTLTEDYVTVNNATFFDVFDQDGFLRDNVTADTIIFFDWFYDEDLVDKIIINRSVVLAGGDGYAYLGNIGIEILSDNVIVDNLFFLNGLSEVITIQEANNVSIINSQFSTNGLDNSSNGIISILDSDNVLIDNNIFLFMVNTTGTYKNTGIHAVESDDLTISNNTIEAFLPSRSIDWATGLVYSEGVFLDNCNNALLVNNTVDVKSYGETSEYGTIYAVHISGDNATIIGNDFEVLNAPYGYALVISGENFNISDENHFQAANGNYACGIEVDGPSNGVIHRNSIDAIGESAYGIYTANWAGDVVANITENMIGAIGITSFGMSLSGSEALVDTNEIYQYDSNFTTGIASAVDNITITNNLIRANGSNVGTPAGYDMMGIETTGVHIVSGYAEVIDNQEITANSKYAVDFSGKGKVTGNNITADMLTGDFAVDYVQDTWVIVANNTPEMELDYTLTNDTFYIYFDEQGILREQITADNLTFIGEFSNLTDVITIDKPIKLLSDNATLNNIGMYICADDVTVDGFNFIGQQYGIAALFVDNVDILNNNFIIRGFNDSFNAAIEIVESNNLSIENNAVIFGVETNGTYKNRAIYAAESDNLYLLNNIVAASLPARPIDWVNGTVYSQGVFLDGCNNAVLENNTVGVKSNNQTGTYDTIYAVNIKGDNATLIGNEFGVVEAPYGYALVISGENFNIANNTIYVGENGTYACGIEVDGTSDGVIDSNVIYTVANESAYGIYTANWAGDVKAEITNNNILVSSNSPFAMSLSGSEALVENNTIEANGNYTTGIASAVDDMIIANNTILANGSNVGTPLGYDTMGIETTGVHIVSGDAIVVNNNITTTGEFAVDAQGTGKVVDNYLVASEYTGDASVNHTPDQEIVVEDNTPEMIRAVISAENIVMYYRNGTRYVVVLTDQYGTPLGEEKVTLTVNGISYTRTTDEDGTASLAINLNSGNYTASASYVGEDGYSNASTESNITVLPTVFGEDLVKVFKNGTQYYATFLDGQGNPLDEGTEVTFNINGVMYKRYVNGDEGKAKLNINLPQGEYIITAINPETNEFATNNVTVLATIADNADLVKYYKNDSQYVVTLIGDDGDPVGAGEEVIFNINGVFYSRFTNESGQAKLTINLPSGNYTITGEYKGCKVSNNIEVLPILRADDLVVKYGESDQFIAYLVDGQGNPYPEQEVSFNIEGVIYQRTTDYDGRAILNTKIGAAVNTYYVTSTYKDFNIVNTITIVE